MTDALLRRLRPSQVRELITVLIIIGIVVFFSTQIDGYLSDRTFNRVSTEFPIIAVVAVGQLLVVLTRNLDLSVGSQVALVAWSTGYIATQSPDINPILLAVMAMGMGVIMGAINGLIVSYGRVPAIITTLATLAIYRSFLITVANAQTIETRGLPDWIVNFPGASAARVGRPGRPAHLRDGVAGGAAGAAVAGVPAVRSPALRHRLQPRCRRRGRPAQAARRVPGLSRLRRAGRPRRPDADGQVRHHHRGSRPAAWRWPSSRPWSWAVPTSSAARARPSG